MKQNEEIQEAENEFNTQKADGEKQLADAEAKNGSWQKANNNW